MRIIAKNKEERDIFLIPPNFLNEGSLFGGMLKLRNTLEAVVLVVGVTIRYENNQSFVLPQK